MAVRGIGEKEGKGVIFAGNLRIAFSSDVCSALVSMMAPVRHCPTRITRNIFEFGIDFLRERELLAIAISTALWD